MYTCKYQSQKENPERRSRRTGQEAHTRYQLLHRLTYHPETPDILVVRHILSGLSDEGKEQKKKHTTQFKNKNKFGRDL